MIYLSQLFTPRPSPQQFSIIAKSGRVCWGRGQPISLFSVVCKTWEGGVGKVLWPHPQGQIAPLHSAKGLQGRVASRASLETLPDGAALSQRLFTAPHSLWLQGWCPPCPILSAPRYSGKVSSNQEGRGFCLFFFAARALASRVPPPASNY